MVLGSPVFACSYILALIHIHPSTLDHIDGSAVSPNQNAYFNGIPPPAAGAGKEDTFLCNKSATKSEMQCLERAKNNQNP